MAGEIAEKQGRSDSGDGVMTWLTGNDPSGGEHDKENDEAGHSFRETVEAIHTEKGGGCGVFYGKPPEHVMRSHEEMSPKKRGWWGGVRDVIKGGQRSVDTIKLAKTMGDRQTKYKERSKRELQEWEEKYKFDRDGDEAKEVRADIEKRNQAHFVSQAEIFRDLALTNGGFQVKLCQMLAMNTALFPPDVRAPLRECCEKAWNVPLETILPNIEGKKRGLGRKWQEVFETLDAEAMAAASIAQVHRATLRRPKGQSVLVKVQHVGVRDALRADVAILPYLIQFVDNMDPNHGLRPLMYMISSMLEQEVDFRVEGANRERLAAIVERSGKSERSRYSTLYFPLVMWDYCVESMMVQEYMEGAVSLGDRQVVEGMGIPFTACLSDLAAFFAECCFVHGYMHNDLHFGNVLVRPKKEPQDAPPPSRAKALARKLVKVPNYAALSMVAFYVGAASLAAAAATLVLAVVVPLLVALVARACPPLGAALYLAGTAISHAKEAAVAAAAAAAALMVFFLGEHLADQDLGQWAQDTVKGWFHDPKMLARMEQAFTFHQQTKGKIDKRIAEVADVRFELIIIDHGFHTHVSYEYRLAWCKLWAGIGLCDEELLAEGCADFGLEGGDYKKMTMILSFFPYPVWRERRFCGLSEFLGYLKSQEEHGLVATQEVTNRKLPKQFHLMHRTSQQIAAHFNAEYGMGFESSYKFLEHMTRYALLGLRFRNRAAADFPVPGKLHTADKAWFDTEMPAVEERMRLDFIWDNYRSKGADVDKDSNIWVLFAKDEAEKWRKYFQDEAEKAAQGAMEAERLALGLSEEDYKDKVAKDSDGAVLYVPPAPEKPEEDGAADKGETADEAPAAKTDKAK